jgi:dTMP kinase
MTESGRGRRLFITFEGPEGSGKTTQLHLLADRLRAAGREVVETQEPGGTAAGAEIRRLLLDPAQRGLCPTAELLLMFASRAQNVDEIILPALAAGRAVLSDRFTDSTLAYQGAGRGLGPEVVYELDRIACRGLVPNLTLLIDIDVETGLARARLRNQKAAEPGTRMDEYGAAFHRKVRDAYRQLASDEPARIRLIDGARDRETVAGEVWSHVVPFLGAGKQ